MKRLLPVGFLVLLLVLFGCGGQNSSSDPQQSAEAQGRSATPAQGTVSTENGRITKGSDTGGDTGSSDNGGDSVSSPLQSFVSKYYEAAGAKDWAVTYSMLDSDSQGTYPQSEWSALQDRRQAASPLPSVSSVAISKTTQNSDGTTAVSVVLDPGKDNETTSAVTVSYDGGRYYRHLTPDEVAYLNGLGPGGSGTGSDNANLEQIVKDFYLAAGANEWGKTYQYLDSRTQDAITEEQWTRRNQFLFSRNPVIYYIDSIERKGNSADVTLRISGEGGAFIMNEVVRFVLEDGGWKYSSSASELESLMPDATFEEFVGAQGDTPSNGTPGPADGQYSASGNQFESFVGEWYRHGEALTIKSDRTGSGVSRIYSTPIGGNCPPDRLKCNVQFEMSFTTATNGVVATITSIKYGDYSDLEVGDTFTLEFAGDNLLRDSRGSGNPYWCNSQTSAENSRKCGA